jgi:hypothetical protein
LLLEVPGTGGYGAPLSQPKKRKKKKEETKSSNNLPPTPDVMGMLHG